LRSLKMTGELTDSVLALTAVYEWENLTAGKVIVPMPVPHPDLAALPAGPTGIEVRGQGDALSGPVAVLRAGGKHRVEARFQLPVTRSAEGFEVRLNPLPVATSSLRIRFEPGVSVSANAPVVAEKKGEHLFGMPGPGEGLVIRWRRTATDALAPVAVRQTCRNLYFLDGAGLQADLGLILTAELSKLPGEIHFALPGETQIIDVSGGAVSHWSVAERTLTVSLARGQSQSFGIAGILPARITPGTYRLIASGRGSTRPSLRRDGDRAVAHLVRRGSGRDAELTGPRAARHATRARGLQPGVRR
jgi:hypothetical protein